MQKLTFYLCDILIIKANKCLKSKMSGLLWSKNVASTSGVSTVKCMISVADPGFSKGGANPKNRSVNVLFGQIFCQNYMNTKKIGPSGGERMRVPSIPSLDLPLHFQLLCLWRDRTLHNESYQNWTPRLVKFLRFHSSFHVIHEVDNNDIFVHTSMGNK